MTFRNLLIALLFLQLSPLVLHAATPNSVSISPAIIELNVRPGGESRTAITVTNSLEHVVHIHLSAEDIQGATDGSGVVTILNATEGPFSIKNFLQTTIREFDLAPGESRTIPIVITLPARVSPGGKYGAILFSISSTQSGKPIQNGSGASLNTRIAATVLVRVLGALIEKSTLTSFDTISRSHLLFRLPTRFFASVQNTGNVHLNTYGLLTIQNMFGQTIFERQVPPTYVLPDATRTLFVDWSKSFGFGYYRAKLDLNRGYGDMVDHRELSLWIFSWPILLLLVALIPVVLVGIRTWRMHIRLHTPQT